MRNASNKWIGFVLAGLAPVVLAACGPTKCPPPVQVQVPVEVTRTVYVPIDAGLTEPHAIAKPRNDSGGECLRVARDRKAELQACNADKAAIRSVQGTEVKP